VDYRKLKGKITEVFTTQSAFAKALDVAPATLSLKLNNKSEWSTGEIAKACDLLNIPLVDAHLYFFTLKV
jgi:UV DNA damage repair endonuclease